jgi:hypothetical protein
MGVPYGGWWLLMQLDVRGVLVSTASRTLRRM